MSSSKAKPMSRADVYGLRLVALLEAFKGGVVVIAGVGLFSLLHHNAREVAERLVRHMHLDPAKHYPQVFIDAITELNDARLWWLALAAGAYAVMRFAEAWGLWYGRAWAEWLAAVSGAIYIPFELYELSRGVNALRLITFGCNVLVVAVMIHALYQRRRAAGQADPCGP